MNEESDDEIQAGVYSFKGYVRFLSEIMEISNKG